jgi:transposase-like protein
VRTEVGDVRVEVPRDRNGTFEPVTVPVGQRCLVGLEQQVISLYAKGLTTGDVAGYLFDVYDQSIDRSTVSRITDRIVGDMQAWQSRPLDSMYPVVLLLCCDGLKGLPDSARAVWPQVDVQLCVVHLVRNSLRYASKKHWGPICKQLREIYTAPSISAAQVCFEGFAAEWEPVYPAMIKSWRDTWDDFEPFLEFPPDLRKIVYSTNAIESLNARFRKAAVRRGHFPTEQAALKVLYLTSIERKKNKTNPTGRVQGWKAILNTLSIHYTDRIQAANN